MIPVPLKTWLHPERRIGKQVHLFDELPSTNDTAAAIGTKGLAVFARHQSAGRGQHGRIWQAESNSSLLASIVVPPVPEFRKPAIITAWVAVGLCESIRELSEVSAGMKWPNDLLVEGRKICGILIESRRETIAGFGLNLNQTDAIFREANLPEATSLSILAGRTFDVRETLETVLDHLDAGFRTIRQGRLDLLERAWVERLGLVGRTVEAVRTDGTTIVGTLTEMNFDALKIAQSHGEPISLPPETIRRLRAV